MKRLTVRLSIVGAVLALGGAAIAHRVLSKGDAVAPSAAGVQQIAKAPPSQPPEPIRAEDAAVPASRDALQAPPASAFAQAEPFRTVSHEDSASHYGSAAPVDENIEPAPTADPIPAQIDSSTASSAYSEYAPASRDNTRATDADHELTEADLSHDTGSAYGDVPADPLAGAVDSTVPDASAHGLVPEKRSTGIPATATAWEPPGAGASEATPPPVTGFALSSRENSAPSTGGVGPTMSPSTTRASDPIEPGIVTPANLSGSSDVSPATASGNAAENPRSGSTLSPGPEMTRAPSSAYAPGATGLAPGAALAGPGGLPWGASSRGAMTSDATVPNKGSSASLGGSAIGGSTDSTSGIPGGPGMYPSTDDPTGRSAATPATIPPGTGSSAVGTPDLSSNVPGDRALEGQQSPALLIEKTAPEEVQVDRQTTFQIRVRNVGTATAHHVVVIDQVPRGTEFVSAVPECAHISEGVLMWNVPTLKTTEEVIFSINLLPKVAGEIGSVAQATFQAQASVRTVCTKPQLSLALTLPEQVLIGTAATLEIVVTNIGSGAATNVVMEEDVPEGFSHAAGRQLEHEIGTLRPQESRRLSLVLDATEPGLHDNRLVVRGDGNLFEEDLRKIEVVTPKLEISMQGPALRYLDRQATYVVRLANAGTAPARNVELVTYLPKGMKYITSDNHGQYDSQTHAVYWSLEELPAEKQGDVQVTVLPIEPGIHKLKADGHAELGLQHMCEHEVVVEGLAELSFSVADVADPIEVGSDTAYEIRVLNRGSKADSDIRLLAELPPGITPTRGDGPVQATVQGGQVVFSPLARLAPNEEAIYKIHATGEATGDHVIRVQLQSAELRVPVTKEEITRVYTDR
ncbi:MAG: hypothetical protein ACYC0X_23660 [Pirellulaceae bacterium]